MLWLLKRKDEILCWQPGNQFRSQNGFYSAFQMRYANISNNGVNSSKKKYVFKINKI